MRTLIARRIAEARMARRMQRTQRQQRQASLEQCAQLLRMLPPDRPASMHELCEQVGAARGRVVRVQPQRFPQQARELAALLVPFPDEHVIIVNEQASRLTKWRGMAHELAHFFLGHCDETGTIDDPRARWFPDLDPEFVARALTLTPGYYPTEDEQTAEALGGRLLTIVLHQNRGRADSTAQADAGVGRHDALYRQFWRLRPLWVELVTAVPDAALFPPRSPLADRASLRDLDHRVSRQVIEIIDIRGLLEHWQDPEVAAIAREHANAAGLPAPQIDATVEAATLAAAARAVRRGTPPTRRGVACAAKVDVDAELARLELVAAAFTGPIVNATLTRHNL
jgi:hypothetical protein